MGLKTIPTRNGPSTFIHFTADVVAMGERKGTQYDQKGHIILEWLV